MRYIALLIVTFCVTLASPALAYVGPGPGLSMLGSALTLLVGIGFALFMVIFYPLRLMWKKRRNKNIPPADIQP